MFVAAVPRLARFRSLVLRRIARLAGESADSRGSEARDFEARNQVFPDQRSAPDGVGFCQVELRAFGLIDVRPSA